MPLHVDVLFVGGGPAGLAPLLWAARQGRLAQVAARGLAIIERRSDMGAGAMSEYAIGSDTLAETFLDCLAEGAEPRLSALRSHDAAARLAAYAGGAAPLPVVAAFLAVLGRTMQEILRSCGAIVLTSHAAEHSRQLVDGRWCTRAVGPEGHARDIVSRQVVIATGAEERIEDIGSERVGGLTLMPALADKLMLSGAALAHGGAARMARRLAASRAPQVAIIGSSHSALASANVLLGESTGIPFGRSAVSLIHRRPLRIFYSSSEAALAEGYVDFTASDVCPVTKYLYRFAGFRLEARELAKRVLGVGGAKPEPRLRSYALTGVDAEITARQILDAADLVIAALGYRPRALRLLDTHGQPIPLAAHAARGAALVDGDCRVLDQYQNPICGVFALGLAAGFVPQRELGGEPSFRGQTNGLWLWQNTIGAMIMRQCGGQPVGGHDSDPLPLRSPRLRVAVIVGTRPEAIKLAPVILALRDTAGVTASVWCTGQHAHWAPKTLAYFGLAPDRMIETTQTGEGLSRLGGTLLVGMQAALADARPDIVVVQGDTSSAFAGALASAYAGIPVVHVEAGLRTGDRRRPFPEEAHRRAIAHFADLHCAPTEAAVGHLRREGVDEHDILCCGNTVIDALMHIQRTVSTKPAGLRRTNPRTPLLLVTCHRRENWGAVFTGICSAIRRIAHRGDSELVFVLHPNSVLADTARHRLGDLQNVHLIEPVGYPDFVQLLTQAALILTDSGGVQEEATALGIPLLVLREKTDRPEVQRTQNGRVIGVGEENIVAAVGELLDDPATLSAIRVPCTVYGDGRAAQRIVEAITARWMGSEPRATGPHINEVAALRGLSDPVSV